MNKDSTSAPKDSPIPPPGPFVVPQPNCNFSEIQPTFATMIAKDKDPEVVVIKDVEMKGEKSDSN
jgi:hypothetical protein